MRFDDGLATVLGQPLDDSAAREVAWRQIVDLLAQARIDGDVRLERDAYRRLAAWRADIPVDVRRAVALSLLGRLVPGALVAFFATDLLSVARPLLAAARVTPSGWLAILADLPPSARALLRHRTDLAPEVERALESFGAADLVLEAPAPAPDPDGPEPAPAPAIDRFAFETGADGIVRWVEGAPRAALIGLSIAAAARPGDPHGVDGHAAGAVRARARFADARLTVGGTGPASGAWRISAVAVFDAASGRFTGHRGVARRPRLDERAGPAADGLFGAGVATPDAVRQLVHELRTPLNAITGFAEMIEHGVMGPAERTMREGARGIAGEARRLAGVIDDLDAAARPDRAGPHAGADPAAVLAGLSAELSATARARGVDLAVVADAAMPPVAADAADVERMMARLVGAMIGLARPGERLAVRLDGDVDGARLSVARPATLAGRGESVLLDPGYTPEGDWPDAPLLGLGFTLRLVRAFAQARGGTLAVRPDALVLALPARAGGKASSAGA